MISNQRTLYGIRVHDRIVETDPDLATIMYTSGDHEGPWFDMATGYRDSCVEILDALIVVEDQRIERLEARHVAESYHLIPDIESDDSNGG